MSRRHHSSLNGAPRIPFDYLTGRSSLLSDPSIEVVSAIRRGSRRFCAVPDLTRVSTRLRHRDRARKVKRGTCVPLEFVGTQAGLWAGANTMYVLSLIFDRSLRSNLAEAVIPQWQEFSRNLSTFSERFTLFGQLVFRRVPEPKL